MGKYCLIWSDIAQTFLPSSKKIRHGLWQTPNKKIKQSGKDYFHVNFIYHGCSQSDGASPVCSSTQQQTLGHMTPQKKWKIFCFHIITLTFWNLHFSTSIDYLNDDTIRPHEIKVLLRKLHCNFPESNYSHAYSKRHLTSIFEKHIYAFYVLHLKHR